jgi:ribonuclease T2
MGQFDFYVLALSWSPGFCENSGSRSRQCDSGRGLGFVTHGLWPQNEQGYPSFCEPSG